MRLSGWLSMDQPTNPMFDINAVDRLLSRELLQLSAEDRNALEEEIHGVRCMAREETPELLQVALQKLAMVLDNDKIIPPIEKQAYLQSQLLPRTYVNSNDFRIRFLRACLFDVLETARRIVKYLDIAAFLFGNEMLERPIRLSDFNKKELQFFRSGRMQFLPFRDRAGRRILILINPTPYDTDLSSFLGQSMHERREGSLFFCGKMFFYMSWIAGEDIDTQRRGLTIIVWFDQSFKVLSSERFTDFTQMQFTANDLASTRIGALHCCVPDTLAHRVIVAVIRMRIGQNARLRLKAHTGQPLEILYGLQSFGIPTDHIPVSFSGTIKTGFMKQWTRAREAQESNVYLELGNDFRDIIECPRLRDVLFRQGISLVSNPGNARVRTIIEKMTEDGGNEAGIGGGDNTKQRNKLTRREMVLDIINEVSETSRFLVWNEGGWWNELLDREQRILKVEYLIKEVRKSKKNKRQHIQLNSSTSIFQDRNGEVYDKKRPRLNDYGQLTDSSDDDRSQSCGKGCFKFS